MEHAFDALSKRLARAVSRREAIGTLLRGAVGTFLVSAGFTRLSLHAQSGACSVCGTCTMVAGSKFEACTDPCEAQTLCGTAQNYAPYQTLVSNLADTGFQPTTYSALISVQGKNQIQVFLTNYVGTDPSYTANLFVVWAPGSQVAAYVIEYLNGNPTWASIVNGSSVVQIVPSFQIPPPFAIAASPSSVTVAHGSPGTCTISTTVSDLYSFAIALKASGLPSGATASFNPHPIPAPGSGSSIMTIKAGALTPTGTYAITVTGTGAKISETTSVSLTVSSPDALADPLEGPVVTPRGGLHLGDTSSDRDIPDFPSLAVPLTLSPCSVACNAVGSAAGKLLGTPVCTELVAVVGVFTCGVVAGPFTPQCLAAVALAGAALVYECVQGYSYVVSRGCTIFCGCPTCQYKNGTSCVPVCNDSDCPPPFTCESDCSCVSPGCPPGSSPCGTVCCPPEQTCCGTTCCPPSGLCINNICVANGGNCPSGTTSCAGSCCPTGTSCCVGLNGIGVCCPTATVCCTNYLPGAQCVPASDICCPYGSCPAGTDCCGAQQPGGFQNYCCTSGETCCAVTGSGSNCCPGGFTCCGIQDKTEVWCCAPGTGCGSTFGSCV